MRAAWLAAVLACSFHTGAQAQAVRKCQVDGRVVFQSSPCAPEPAPAAMAAPAPQPLATGGPKKKTLAELLHDRDANDRVRLPVREAQNDGAMVLRSRMGAV